MPRFEVPSNAVSAGMLILDKGDYSFIVGEPETFLNLDRETNEPRNWGVSFPVTIIGGDHDGKNLPQRFYLHSDGAVKMTKGFVMSVLGYNPSSQSDEAEFNAEYDSLSIDPDTNFMANCYLHCAGKRVDAFVDVKPNPVREGEVQNSFRWRAIPK